MAITNHERVGKAMDLLKAGLGPFIEREFKAKYQARAQSEAALFLGEDRLKSGEIRIRRWATGFGHDQILTRPVPSTNLPDEQAPLTRMFCGLAVAMHNPGKGY